VAVVRIPIVIIVAIRDHIASILENSATVVIFKVAHGIALVVYITFECRVGV
jgi:hypothetical protein